MMAVLVACQVRTYAANNDNKKEGDQRELDRENPGLEIKKRWIQQKKKELYRLKEEKIKLK